MAIAYDNSSSSSVTGASSITYSHTCSGADRLLVIQAYVGSSRTITSVTYNGVSATQLADLDLGFGERHYCYYLASPATGANNVVINLNNTADIESACVSYTGVDTADPIDDFRTETDLATGTSYSESVTSTVDNTWGVWLTREYAVRTITAGSGTALRQRLTVAYGIILADSNTNITPAGAYAMNLDANLSGNWFSDILLTINPATATTVDYLTLLGVS